MKRLNVILSIIIVMALVAGGLVVAQETDVTGKDADPQFRGMRGRGRGQMMGRGGQMHGMGYGGQMRGMGRGRRGGPGRMSGLLRLADEVDLSEAQRDELSEIFTSHRKDTIKRKAEIELAKVDLQKLARQEEPDMDAVEAQLRKIADLQVEMKLSQIKVRVDPRDVLTEEQKTALKKIRQDWQEEREATAQQAGGWWWNMRRGGPGPCW